MAILVIIGVALGALLLGCLAVLGILASARSGGSIPDSDRVITMLAHLSGLGAYVIPLGGIIIPIVFIMVSERGTHARGAATQALGLNVFAWLMGLFAWFLAITIIGLPVALLMAGTIGIVAVVLPIYGGLKALAGSYLLYPFVGGFGEIRRVA